MTRRQWWHLIRALLILKLIGWYVSPRRDDAVVALLAVVLGLLIAAICVATAGYGPA